MATKGKATRKAAVKALAINRNPNHFQNYDDKTVNRSMTPEASREANAFDRYLICGIFYEVQLVGFSDYGHPVYRVFTTPDLTGQYNILIARKGRKVMATVTNLDARPSSSKRSNYDALQWEVKEATDELTFEVATPAAADALILAQAWEIYMGFCTEIHSQAIDRKYSI
jgi:hypothetical protein